MFDFLNEKSFPLRSNLLYLASGVGYLPGVKRFLELDLFDPSEYSEGLAHASLSSSFATVEFIRHLSLPMIPAVSVAASHSANPGMLPFVLSFGAPLIPNIPYVLIGTYKKKRLSIRELIRKIEWLASLECPFIWADILRQTVGADSPALLHYLLFDCLHSRSSLNNPNIIYDWNHALLLPACRDGGTRIIAYVMERLSLAFTQECFEAALLACSYDTIDFLKRNLNSSNGIGNLKCLSWNDFVISEQLQCEIAASPPKKAIPIFDLILKMGQGLSVSVFNAAAREGQTETILFLEDRGCPTDYARLVAELEKKGCGEEGGGGGGGQLTWKERKFLEWLSENRGYEMPKLLQSRPPRWVGFQSTPRAVMSFRHEENEEKDEKVEPPWVERERSLRRTARHRRRLQAANNPMQNPHIAGGGGGGGGGGIGGGGVGAPGPQQ